MKKDNITAEQIGEALRAGGEQKWFQNFFLRGFHIPGRNPVLEICIKIQLPKDLTGMTVLDVGANEGGFSFECEKRGAERVVAIDLPGPHVERFKLLKEAAGSEVEYIEKDVCDLDPASIGKFDIVLFPGVLYHLKHPLLAIEKLHSVTNNMCLIETHIMDGYPVGGATPYATPYDIPLCRFWEHGFSSDETNWCSPNIECVMAWFRTAGFSIELLQSSGSRATFRATI